MALRLQNKPRSVRLTRRNVLQSIGAGAGLALTNLIPKFVHAAPIETPHQVTPYWDTVIQHVNESSPHGDRDVEGLLLNWIADMVLSPSERREALVVHGSTGSGKTALHNAMSTLLDQGQYLHGCDEHWLLTWGLQPGRRLAAFERGDLMPSDRKRRDTALSKQVHSFGFKELLLQSPPDEKWKPGIASHRNSLWWYEAVLDERSYGPDMQRRSVRACPGARLAILETHLYLTTVKKPIPRLDLIHHLEDERAAFIDRLRLIRES